MKLKNTKKICNPYLNENMSLKKRFFTTDEKSCRYIDKLNRVKGRTFLQNALHPVELVQYSLAKKKMDKLSDEIINFISVFTNYAEYKQEDVDKFKRFLLSQFSELENIKYNSRDICDIQLKNGEKISFQSITSAFDGLESAFPDLLTGERQGKCHGRSLMLTKIFSDSNNTFDNKSECVTGVVWNLLPNTRILHSWVEMELRGMCYCLDNNLNVAMPRDDYYKLHHPQILQRIDAKTIMADWNKIKILNARSSDDTPYLKLYCASRDEALEKYKELKRESNEEVRYQ